MTYFDFAAYVLMKSVRMTASAGVVSNLDDKFEDFNLTSLEDEQSLKDNISELVESNLFDNFPDLESRVSVELLNFIGREINSRLSISPEQTLEEAAQSLSEILAKLLPGDSTKTGRD